MPKNRFTPLTNDQIKTLVSAYPKVEPVIELGAHAEPGSGMARICEYIGVMTNDLLSALQSAPAPASTAAQTSAASSPAP